MKPIQFAKDEDVIDICRDEVFKAVFTKETIHSRKTRNMFLSAFLGQQLKVLTITANEPPVSDLRDRKIRYDINLRFANGERANLEMTKDPDPFEVFRMEYYLARLYTGQEIKGTDRDYRHLKQTWHFSILGNSILFKDDALIHQFEYYDRENQTIFGGRTGIITLELEKVGLLAEKSVEEMSSRERWAVFLRYCTDRGKRELINEILQVEEGIAMAGRVMRGFTQHELDLFRDISEEKAIVDTRSWRRTQREKLKEIRAEVRAAVRAEVRTEILAEVQAEVRTEVQAEVRAEEKIDIARKMKSRGRPLAEIAEDTGLPPEILEKL